MLQQFAYGVETIIFLRQLQQKVVKGARRLKRWQKQERGVKKKKISDWKTWNLEQTILKSLNKETGRKKKWEEEKTETEKKQGRREWANSCQSESLGIWRLLYTAWWKAAWYSRDAAGLCQTQADTRPIDEQSKEQHAANVQTEISPRFVENRKVGKSGASWFGSFQRAGHRFGNGNFSKG